MSKIVEIKGLPCFLEMCYANFRKSENQNIGGYSDESNIEKKGADNDTK